MKRFEKEGRAVSPHALVTLFAGTVIILFQLFYIIFDTLCGTHENFYYTVALYQKCLDYVLTEEDGMVMNPQTPTRQFSNFLKRHNIRHLKFHGLRHTSATMLLANGCDIKTVSSRLGHADIETTGIYVHALQSTDRKAAQTFDAMFPRNNT